MKAKQLSKYAMIASVIWIIIMAVLRAIWGLFSPSVFGLSVGEIISIGAAISQAFLSVNISMIAKNIKGGTDVQATLEETL